MQSELSSTRHFTVDTTIQALCARQLYVRATVRNIVVHAGLVNVNSNSSVGVASWFIVISVVGDVQATQVPAPYPLVR